MKVAPVNEPVALSFALEPHVAEVETTWERTFRDLEGTEVDRSGVHYESVVEATAEGFVLSTRNLRHGVDGAWGAEAMVAALAEGVRVVITPDGEVVEVEGVEGFRERIDLWLDNDPDLQPHEEIREAAREMLIAYASPDYLQKELGTEWLVLLPIWMSHPLEIGRRYEDGEPTFTYAALERTACTEGDPDAGCVVLEMEPARGEAMRELTGMVLDRLGVTSGAMIVGGDTIRLVVRISDLRPYRLERERQCQVLGRVGDKGELFGLVEVRTTTWSYRD